MRSQKITLLKVIVLVLGTAIFAVALLISYSYYVHHRQNAHRDKIRTKVR
jgi:hypothetical protein